MKKNNYLNYIIIIISAIIVVLLCYSLIFKKNFKINNDKINIKIGETKVIDYEISDSNKKIEWTSSNNNITISNNGEIKANNYGNSLITGKVDFDGKIITSTCMVTVYSGDIGVNLQEMEYNNGYIVMKPNSEVDIPLTTIPANAYLSSISYSIDDSNIAFIDNNKIISRNSGTTKLKINVNGNYNANLNIKVSEDIDQNSVIKEIDKISFKDNTITVDMGSTTKLEYTLNPQNGIIDNSIWTSSNEDIVTVNDGEIKAINKGNAIVKVIINNKVEGSINVIVKESNADIVIDYNPKTLLRIGENTKIKAHLEPNSSEAIDYKSNNPAVASVVDGTITGVSDGRADITMSLSNGKTKAFTINVLPKTGHIDGSGYLWGYKSLNAKVPVYADITFYQNLAQNGIGLLQGDTYMISYENLSFSYNITTSLLSVGGKRIKFKIYYPQGEDLSTLNTLVYMGGRGEANFDGAFANIAKDPSMIKSAGIVGLLAEGNSFDGDSGAYSTKFIKAITKQKAGVQNSILGFSDGAHKVLHAANKENYKSIVIFSGYTDGASGIDNAKNKEIIFMIAGNDANYSQAKSAMNNMRNSGYQNVTMVTTANDLSNYENSVLIINANNLMKKGHYSENVFTSGIIEYLND